MKFALRWCVVPLLATTLVAQTTAKRKPKTTAAAPAAVTAEEVQSLRNAVTAQGQQIDQLRQALQQSTQAWQAAQQQLQQAQAAAAEAQQKAAAAETAATGQQETVAKLSSDFADVQTTLTNSALNTQDDQKRFSALETLVGRFRFSGDVRVRYENFFFDYTGCANPNCNPRHRERIRLRLGVQGQLNQDFSGGIYIASGTLDAGLANFKDPVSTNETLTGFFERKAVGFDRGWITYNPARFKWLSLTGGKFAFTWTRTPLTFDNDLNPEGFSQQLSFNVANKFLKNVTFTGMQILFTEIGGDNDSFAAGGQASVRLQPASWLTVTPSYSLLNWRNADTIAAARAGSSTTATLLGNGNTNAPLGTNLSAFNSHFLYSDLIVDSNIRTPWARWPIRVLLEYERNLNAEALSTGIVPSKQDMAYWLEGSIGRIANPKDVQFGYSFARVEQDAVISLFAESDMRAATNVLQNRFYVNYRPARNTTIGYTAWVGRTLNRNLPRAALAPGLPAGETDPWLKRMQFDLIYSF